MQFYLFLISHRCDININMFISNGLQGQNIRVEKSVFSVCDFYEMLKVKVQLDDYD